jgi:hypothetical protein
VEEIGGVDNRPAVGRSVVGSSGVGECGCGGGGGWTRLAQADCMAVMLRLVSAMLRARDSSVMAPPDGDEASERTDEAGSIPGAETSSAPVTVGKVSETDGAGGGPDIADIKLLGFLTLPVRVRRL